jgi:hypothetical protein
MEELIKLLEIAAEDIKYADPIDSTQWAYNEGIEDLIIAIKNKIDK